MRVSNDIVKELAAIYAAAAETDEQAADALAAFEATHADDPDALFWLDRLRKTLAFMDAIESGDLIEAADHIPGWADEDVATTAMLLDVCCLRWDMGDYGPSLRECAQWWMVMSEAMMEQRVARFDLARLIARHKKARADALALA